MRLEVKQSGNVHRELVAAVGWNSKNELFSCGDDKQVVRWDAGGMRGGRYVVLQPIPSITHTEALKDLDTGFANGRATTKPLRGNIE